MAAALGVAVCLLLCVGCCGALGSASAEGGRTILVLVDSLAVQHSHSRFFSFLREQGFSLSFQAADAPSLTLFKFGEPLYDHLILFAPAAEEYGGGLSSKGIIDFVDQGGNVLLAASRSIGAALDNLVPELGFEFDVAQTAVVDHVHHVHGDVTLVRSSDVLSAPAITGLKSADSVVFRGVALKRDPSNPLALSVVRASSTAYSWHPEKPVDSYPFAVGKEIVLVGALQARNNARVVLCGSLDLFSDQLFAVDGSGNEQLAQHLVLWALQQRGVLRSGPPMHRLAATGETLNEYTINDVVDYEISLEERVGGAWRPWTARDVQLEFVRIDPFVHLPLENHNGTLKAQFRLPDVSGVFQFRLDYKRVGYSFIYSTAQVSVRPLRHSQRERFMVAAYPYYAGALSMLVGLMLFSVLFLHMREPQVAKKKAE